LTNVPKTLIVSKITERSLETVHMLPSFSLIFVLVLISVLILIEDLIAVGRQKVKVRVTEKRKGN